MNTDIISPHFNDLGPRANFAYSPFADKKTVIRGGYDIFYSNAYSAVNSAQAVDNAIGYTPFFYWSGSSNPTQCANYSGQCVSWNLDSTTSNKAALTNPPFTTVFPAENRDPSYTQPIGIQSTPVHDPMVQNWTLVVQRELTSNTVLTVGYVGSHGTHLVGGLWAPYNFVPTADKLQYRTACDQRCSSNHRLLFRPNGTKSCGGLGFRFPEPVDACGSLPLLWPGRPSKFI
jgi:hypothetical protein